MTTPLDTRRLIDAAHPWDVWIGRDPDTQVWFVERSDMPGLNVEAASSEELVDIIRDLAPRLVDGDGPEGAGSRAQDVPVRVQHRVDARRVRAA